MAENFDPYHIWLGIPPDEQPPNHYRLLGIAAFESDPDVISIAAQRQMAHVKNFAIGRNAELSQNLLNELARAKICLLSPARKVKYDAALRALLAGRHTSFESGKEKEKEKDESKDKPVSQPPQVARRQAGSLPHQPSAAPPQEAPAPPTARTWVFGTAAECDVVVKDPTISRRHCRLTLTPQGCFLEDLSSTNGTFLNGRQVTARIAVSHSDQVRLGHNTPLPWPKEIPASKARLIRVGAAPDNDVVLDIPMISWHHALIRVEGGKAFIEDLGSTNGTAVGRRSNRIQRSELKPSDKVFLGSHEVPAAELFAPLRRTSSGK
jgi:pSer/pThr/pTyr-binding forkhead associated (FHA) protein